MTQTLTIRLPATLVRDLKAKARSHNTNPSAVLRRAAAEYVRDKNGSRANAMQDHIAARAGTWDGYCSGVELLRRTRP
jgi:predicted transcriptional regulator